MTLCWLAYQMMYRTTSKATITLACLPNDVQSNLLEATITLAHLPNVQNNPLEATITLANLPNEVQNNLQSNHYTGSPSKSSREQLLKQPLHCLTYQMMYRTTSLKQLLHWLAYEMKYRTTSKANI